MPIKLLDKSVYELIAAGEVIERPSSVVKELVENSIDAGATKITVEIKNGGRQLIRVTDNGCGIPPDEIPTAFERHATSKITCKEDLICIDTLGFRGEALASICAVSKVELTTKTRGSALGVRYSCNGDGEVDFEECGCPDGTTISVRELFYNVPARLKFLKKDVSEGNSVANMISKISLSHPEISFKFIRDGRADLVTPGDGALLSAIYAVFGREFYGGLLPVDYSLSGVNVSGYVTKPLSAKANRSFQNFFVNSRYVKSVTCMVALEEAYRNEIMIGKFPACVLRIDIDPAATDVNVHPAKLEIRFSDEKPVYDAVYFAVKNALMIAERSSPESAIKNSAPIEKPKLTPQEIFKQPEPKVTQLTFGSSPAMPEPAAASLIEPDLPSDKDQDKGFDLPEKEYIEYYKPKDKMPNSDFVPPFHVEPIKPEMPKNPEISEKPEIIVVGEIFKTYIICQCGDDMYLIDKHAAHERYNFERLKNGTASVETQRLLNPFEVALSYDAHTSAVENIDILDKFGFSIEPLDPPNVMLCGVPILLTDEDPADLLTVAADCIASGKISGPDAIFDELFRSVACKASIKANQTSAPEELKRLAELVIEDNIRYCPHGRPAVLKLSKYEIEKLFKRVQ